MPVGHERSGLRERPSHERGLMCGVVAIVAPRASGEELRRLASQLTGAVAHRGPDHQGVDVEGSVALGHARLRVVDLRAVADQPMRAARSRIVFSGAILDHRRLREELARDHGVAFRTTGDTEVLLHALARWGEDAIPRLQGMFAFVFHDLVTGRVIAARDRAGIKPLVWARRGDGAVLLASEAKGILRFGGIDRAIDHVALQQTLRFNHPLGDRTFFEHVRSLEPGCVLTLDAGRAEPEVRRYASLAIRPRRVGLDEAARELDGRFRVAMDRATDVDVPLGCYLSGGVDSSGLAAELASRDRAERLYSLVLPDPGGSEEPAIDGFTTCFGLRTTKVSMGPLELPQVIDYAVAAEMPQWWTSDLALGTLARRAKADGTRVVLSGEGPDELFAGYDAHRLAFVRPLLVRLGPLADIGAAALPFVRRFVPWAQADMSIPRAWLASHHPSRDAAIVDHFGFHPENVPLWSVLDARRPLSAPLRAREGDHRAIERAYFHERVAPRTLGLGNLERNLDFEISERLPRWILHMGDRMSSAHGLELRFPYLDDDFVAHALTLPMSARANLFEDKRVHRRMHRSRLPRAIAARPKRPLYTPVQDGARSLVRDPRFARYWSRAAFERAGLLDFDVCDMARARLVGGELADGLTRLVDEWLFTFALTTSILAVDVAGA